MSQMEGEFPSPEQEDGGIEFFVESPEFSLPFKELSGQEWLSEIAQLEGRRIGNVSIILCSDEYLYNLNVQYLNHDTYTDILTFPYEDDPLVADMYISTERVAENAETLSVTADTELRRVIAHGLLHLCGYGDKTEEEQLFMREKEELCLRLWQERFS